MRHFSLNMNSANGNKMPGSKHMADTGIIKFTGLETGIQQLQTS